MDDFTIEQKVKQAIPKNLMVSPFINPVDFTTCLSVYQGEASVNEFGRLGGMDAFIIRRAMMRCGLDGVVCMRIWSPPTGSQLIEGDSEFA